MKWRKKLVVLGRQEDEIRSLAFSPDGKFLALGYAREDIVQLLNMRTGKFREILDIHKRGRIYGDVQCLQFSPDGKILAIGGCRSKTERHSEYRRIKQDYKGIIILWDGEEKRELPEVDMPGTISWSMGVTSLSFSADGSLLAAGYFDGTVRIWDMAEEKCLWTFKVPIKPFRVYSVSLSPDGNFVAAGGRDWEELENSPVMVWDVRTGKGPKLLSGLSKPVSRYGIFFSPDGRILAACDYKKLIFWDVTTWRKVRETRPGMFPKIAFSPDGKLLATATGMGAGKARGHKVTLFDVEKGKLIKVLGKGGHIPWFLSFSPDGATLAVVYNIYERKQMARGKIGFELKESYLGLWWLPGCLDQWPPE